MKCTLLFIFNLKPSTFHLILLVVYIYKNVFLFLKYITGWYCEQTQERFSITNWIIIFYWLPLLLREYTFFLSPFFNSNNIHVHFIVLVMANCFELKCFSIITLHVHSIKNLFKLFNDQKNHQNNTWRKW